jgi:Cu/Zn superoxide dismutase
MPCGSFEGITMRVLISLALLLAATAANAETFTTTVSPDRKTVTTTGANVTATTQISRDANVVTRTTTITPNGGYQPMGSSGYHPMSH